MANSTPICRSLLYYATVYAYLYGAYFILHYLGVKPTPVTVLATNFMTLVFLLLLAYYISTPLRGKRGFLGLIGLRGRKTVSSLVVSGAFTAAPGLVLVGVALLMGLDLPGLVYENASRLTIPWFEFLSGPTLPLAALAVWGLSGFVSFSLLQAFPYEIMSGERKLLPLLIVSLGFIGLYNLPLATGEWKLDDIIVLGILYPAAYAITRSSIGLIINYVALFELPLASAVLRGLGSQAFYWLMEARLALGIAYLASAIILLALRRSKNR